LVPPEDGSPTVCQKRILTKAELTTVFFHDPSQALSGVAENLLQNL
jgi:hypothetical protein